MIFNSVNTNSAGTSNVTKIILNESDVSDLGPMYVEDNVFFKDFSNCNHVHSVHFGNGILRIVNRLKFDLITFPNLVKKKKVDSVVIMANYCPLRLSSRKLVIMRHPYLVDFDSWKEIKTFKHRLQEIVRLFLFKITLRSTDVLIVQTQAMYDMFKKEYPSFKGSVKILPNPVSLDTKNLSNIIRESYTFEDYKYLFYPSRYYSHKNHEFLIDFAKAEADFFKENKYKFLITLSPEGEGKHIIERIKREGLDEFFHNLGEVDQNCLHKYYANAFCLFYPSNAETFGNCIIESQYAGLPILIKDKPYAKTLCMDSAFYFNDIDSAMDGLKSIESDWSECSKQSRSLSHDYYTASQWLEKISSF
ncbi:hypothetical protein BOO35_19530 [Vibrio navarrensis]|uniref:glycosyltransferase n=1 Tax=Vibrio navarrensis TaxID=29495 RepID=UPI001868B22E|nr:glycosyltransferase [Vibrio navarrensis]MBE3667247.1 hypothetical protein [Vibrio navarrensis]